MSTRSSDGGSWHDDPGLAHLRDDAPYVVCSTCKRQSWAGNPAGSPCGMPQPDGSSCAGTFGLPVQPTMPIPEKMSE